MKFKMRGLREKMWRIHIFQPRIYILSLLIILLMTGCNTRSDNSLQITLKYLLFGSFGLSAIFGFTAVFMSDDDSRFIAASCAVGAGILCILFLMAA